MKAATNSERHSSRKPVHTRLNARETGSGFHWLMPKGVVPCDLTVLKLHQACAPRMPKGESSNLNEGGQMRSMEPSMSWRDS